MSKHETDCLADIGVEDREEMDEATLEALYMDAAGSLVAATEQNFRVRTDVRTGNHGPNAMVTPPWGIILHHTAGAEHVDLPTLTRSGSGVSSNDYITKQGVIYELVPFNRRAWHAGTRDASQAGKYYYDGNTYYWGIEIENYGNGRDPYPKVQVDAVVWRCRQLRKRWPNVDAPAQIFRHRDFAPSRKVDTSNNFPFEEVRRRILAATDPTDDNALPKPGPAYRPKKRYSVIVPDTAWAKGRAEHFRSAFPDLVDVVEDQGEAARASQFCVDHPKLGEFVSIAMGVRSVPLLSPAAKKSMATYPREKTDVWSAATTREAYLSFARIAKLEGKDFLVAGYTRKFGGASVEPTKPKPAPEPKTNIDFGPYSRESLARIHNFFQSATPNWGLPYRREDGEMVARVADDVGMDLALALAVIEQESNCRRVMGCDKGNVGDRPPYCNQEATRERVQRLITASSFKTTGMNGIGLPQMTWWEFTLRAEKMGGAHIPEFQLRVCLGDLAQMLGNYGLDQALGRYNAGSNWRTVYAKYINPVKNRQAAWKKRLS